MLDEEEHPARLERLLGVPPDGFTERKRKYIDGLRFRAIVAGLFLIAFCALEVLELTDRDPLARTFPFLLILVCVNWLYWRAGIATRYSLGLFFVHWAVDQVMISSILLSLGGIEVPYGFLAYVMIIVTSATFVSKRASFIVACGAAICTTSIGAVEMLRPSGVAPVWGAPMDNPTIIASVVFVILFYLIFAYLAGTLADQLKEATLEVTVARNAVAAQNRRLEDRVKRRTLELERRNTEVEEFVHVVTHDLRNVAVGVTELARRLLGRERPAMTERGVRDAERLLEDTRRMNEMLSSLLGIFRAEREEQVVVAVELDDIVQSVVRAQADRLEGKRVTVSIGSLPRVNIDAARLTHVMRNLIDNAIKYVGDKADPHISISGRQSEFGWQVEVRDNGVGIEAGQLEKIFQLYHRGPQQVVSGQEQAGEGVGLAMCKRIVERWGGRISVESEYGRGSVFRVDIPGSVDPGGP